MALPDIILSVSLLSLGGVFVGAGLRRLDRLDRRRMEDARQDTCRWHHWRVLEDGTSLMCDDCGKRNHPGNSSDDRIESISSETNPP